MIVVVGDIGWDFVIRSDQVPRRGETLVGELEYDGPGGGSANTAATIAASGIPVGLVTSLGRDSLGGSLKDACSQYPKLKVMLLPFDGRTQFATILLGARGERTIVVGRNHSGVHPTPAALSLLEGASLAWVNEDTVEIRSLYSDSAGCSRGLPLAHLEQEANAARRWDFLVGSGRDHERPSEDALRSVNAQLCVVTQGGAGGDYWTPAHAWTRYPAEKAATVRDSVGAGDAFLAGLLAGLSFGEPVVVAVHTAAVWGSRAVATPGGWPHPNRES